MATRMAFGRVTCAAVAIIAVFALSVPAPAVQRMHRGPSVLEQARAASPLLGGIVEAFAARDFGEGAAEGLDDRTREIATAAALAAIGDVQAARRHAHHALRYGATDGQLKEVLYLTAVHAGAPKAIDAARAFEDLLAD